jgi:hypothetical protein
LDVRSRCFSIIIAQEPAQSLAALHGLLEVEVCIAREQQDVAFPLVIPLSMEMFDIFAQRPPQGTLAEEVTLDKHSSFTDLTQRSA